jgi:beta-mannanase
VVTAGVAVAVLASTLRVNSPEAYSVPCRVAWGTYVTGGPLASDMVPVRAVDDHLGRHSQLIHWYVPWGASWGTFDYQRPLLDNMHNYSSQDSTGAVPLITWEPWAPPFRGDGTDVPLPAIAAGQFDAYIDSWAVGLRQLGYRVLIDFAHEMNGNWYPWGSGVNGNTADQYIAAFRHVHDRFALADAETVRFVWNPNNESSTSPASVFYPGDAYVDWLAIDAYNSNWAWRSPFDEIGPIYREITALNPTKPLMLAEVASMATPPVGARPVDKAAWISELARALAQSFPRIRAVVWFNEFNTEFPIDSSPDVLAAAVRAFHPCGGQDLADAL